MEKIEYESKKIIKKFRLYLLFLFVMFIILETTLEPTLSFFDFGITWTHH